MINKESIEKMKDRVGICNKYEFPYYIVSLLNSMSSDKDKKSQ